MPTSEIRSDRDRINNLFKSISIEQHKVDISLLSVFSSFMAIKAAGYVEKSVKEILSEYARRNTNKQILQYISSTVEYENSLNCEKIQKIFDRFEKSWWEKIDQKLDQSIREGVNSLKTIRDQIAHGKHNGTGLTIVKQYFDSSTKLIEISGKEILK